MAANSNYRIHGMGQFQLYAVAVLLDAISIGLAFIPGLGIFMSIFAIAVFSLWFTVLGVSFFLGRKPFSKIGTFMLTTIVEMLPLGGAFPAITFWVYRVITLSHEEDKERMAKSMAAAAKAAASKKPATPGATHTPSKAA